MAVCSLTLFACNNNKTTEHIHGENCNHEHTDDKSSHHHTHDENCNHEHTHDMPVQESFTVEPESN